jgi:hypothetical protein
MANINVILLFIASSFQMKARNKQGLTFVQRLTPAQSKP